MHNLGSIALMIGGSLSAIAALAHLACIALGTSAYRFMGAGERMARAVEAGKRKPALITLAIASILLLWALYAFSGAGIIPRLPLTKVALALISVVYLARAIAFPLLKPAFPENSRMFWWVSSSICLVLGLLHAVGTVSL
jgi:phosphatidylglycerophosphate synthase